MRDGAQAPRGGGGFFSARSLSNYMRIVSSGASTAASTLRSAGASLVNSIASHEEDGGRDQVQWAGFDKLECGGGMLRQVLLLAYKSGFQVWDVEHADDVRQLESRHDGPVSFIQLLKNPIATEKSEDRFADVRPLLAVACDGTYTGTGNGHDTNVPVFDGTNGSSHNVGTENLPTVIRFYSLRTHEYVHTLNFRSAVYSIRCSPRVVAVSQATQIHCFDAATLERDYTVLTSPTVAQISGFGPLGLGPRWIAYSGIPVPVPDTGRVSPQLLSLSPFVPPPGSNGSVVAYYAKESSKQLAAGIVTLGDVGYKKLSKYCSDFIPNGHATVKQRNSGYKTNGAMNGHRIDSEYAGMVIVRDIVSKLLIVQFRAHTSPISALCFDPSGTLLVTASVHGQNINVFRIVPPPGNASEAGQVGTYVHLYKLQRGITNAVIKDISFSDDSEWIMISSSRGTSHLFAISPYSGSTSFHYSDNNPAENNYVVDSSVKPTAHWSQHSSPSLSLNQKTLFISGPPVTLSVVSRIRNGSNMFKGAVHGAAAFATGVSSPISGAIASTFHNCKGADLSSDGSLQFMKYYLLVFSPSGSIIQYVLHRSAEQDPGFDFPSGPVSYGPERETDTKFVIEALQKWDVCHKRNRRDNAESFTYGDFENGENNKLFQRVMKKGTSIYPLDSADENRNFFISESELQTNVVQIPLWSRSGIHFQVMKGGNLEADSSDTISGEVEIEKILTHNIESRSKNLIPVFDSLHTSIFQQTRLNTPDNNNRYGLLQRQKSGISEDGRLSHRSSCSSLDCMSEGPKSSDDGGFSKYVVDDSGSAVNKNPDVKFVAELVNNTGSLKSEAQLGFVNSKEDGEDREQLPDLLVSLSHTTIVAYKSRVAGISLLTPLKNRRRKSESEGPEMTRTAQLVPLLVAAIAVSLSPAAAFNSTASHPSHHPNLLAAVSQWRERYMADQSSPSGGGGLAHGVGLNTVAAWVLSFFAAAVSSAGGVGGGSLFLPILNVVAGLSLKRATTYSSFMVTGGAASNVVYNLVRTGGGGRLIDYDIALLFQPCLLLGVSIGVVCNLMFPEWLITVLFSLFLAFCTYKTWRAGVKIWRAEGGGGNKEPLITRDGSLVESSVGGGAGFPCKDVALLVVVWLCFFALHVFIGDKHGKGVIRIKPCGVVYWLITLSQLPFAVAFTWYIIYAKSKKQIVHDQEDGKETLMDTGMETLSSLTFPLAAFVTGALSGLFGIGGGLLLNPVLLQIGIPPQTAAATSTFMVLFCASMSMVQFILLGMRGIGEASIYGAICFVASVVGSVVIHRAIRKSGRISLIVFLVTGIMALSAVIVTCVGALDVWVQYTTGAYLGFKLPCTH
ncbi:hypothetical protein EJB05_16711 [Eragrostis curvula]|uniref:Uncharacterized protein n=1 Tax=Eragrostis curvula TaxID=38414 RepID=A0A5J9VH69_9POAL|nr:hypothetical protein EJB05_16711 [Eragrostis curvula]